MPNRWLLKTEPSTYSFADLVRDKRTRWDGVKNPVAQKHLRAMAEGDEVVVYHTGDEKACVGLARVTSAPYPDPRQPTLSCVDLEAVRLLRHAVTLATVKADAAFSGFDLARLPRLSVMPVGADHWRRLMALASGA